MQKILHKVPKNRWFVKRVWWPITFIQECETANVEVNSETKEVKQTEVARDTDYQVVQVGWGQRVYCMIHTSLRSPLPVMKYMSIDRAEALWLKDASNMLVLEGLEVNDEDAHKAALDLMKRYTLDTTPVEAVKDFYADALGESSQSNIVADSEQ